MYSIILTIHNKQSLIRDVLESIKKYTIGSYELNIILDGCTDNSELITDSFIKENENLLKINKFYAPNVFETKANNIGLKNSLGEYCIIVQDDMIINEHGWNERLLKPIKQFSDVFAVTSRTAHNWAFNSNTKHLMMKENLSDCWCDILNHVDHAGREHGLDRNTFAVRDCVNRGPLLIVHKDLEKINYLDEAYSPQDMDDHDLCYRAYKQLNKIVGCYWIDYISHDSWGGTRVSGKPASWLLEAHHKNTKIFYERHKQLIETRRIIENRRISL